MSTWIALIFQFASRTETFIHSPEKRITISKVCMDKNGNLHCNAYDSLKKASYVMIRPELQNSSSPGSKICEKQLGGYIVMGQDSKKNENSFCRFEDGSMVDIGSIDYWARRNDRE